MQRIRTSAVWVALIVAVILVAAALQQPAGAPPYGSRDQLRGDLEAARIAHVSSDGATYTVRLHDGAEYVVDAFALDPTDYEVLAGAGIPIEFDTGGLWGELLVGGVGTLVVPVVVVGVLGWFVWRVVRNQQARSGGQLLDMAKSRARLLEKPPASRFGDVGGCAEAKEHLSDLVDFLRHPEAWRSAGARVPRGVLLEGPPGTGKTHLARAVAGEAGVRFFVATGSDFVEMLIGVGAARVRDLFETAAKVAPAVIFIDEIDAIGRRRGSGTAAWNEERELTLNQLLAAMDGFQPTDRVVVIGATNRSDILDPALVRAGRFDVVLPLSALDADGRRQVLAIHARGKPLAADLDLGTWAELTEGATGATIEQLLNQAALTAVRRRSTRGGKVEIRDEDLAAAWEVVSTRAGGLAGLDKALVGSAWQLVRPDAPHPTRVVLTDGRVVVGDLVWADGVFLKLQCGDGVEVAIAKSQVVTIEAGSAARPRVAEAG
jgi:cell division protease FtsH